MALGSTVFVFDVQLSDVDRGVYEALSLKVAQHPSESNEYLIARVLAYCLEYVEGVHFTEGLSNADEPAVAVRDLTGQLVATIEVGTPDAARLHKASKASERVAVYCHKDPAGWLKQLAAAKVYSPGKISLWQLDRDGVQELVAGMLRRNVWSLSRMEDTLYVEAGSRSVMVPITALPWPR
jgi:uncharacterized protein YaeQ